MGRLPKVVHRRQGHHATSALRLVSPAESAHPEAAPASERSWLAITRRRWVQYWASPLARLAERATDLPAIERLFGLYDERERAYRAFRRRRLVTGSQGQPVVNPLWKQVPVMDAEIRQLEDRLGLTPRARLQLGVTFGAAARSLEDLNQDLAIDDDRDPRLTETPAS